MLDRVRLIRCEARTERDSYHIMSTYVAYVLRWLVLRCQDSGTKGSHSGSKLLLLVGILVAREWLAELFGSAMHPHMQRIREVGAQPS